MVQLLEQGLPGAELGFSQVSLPPKPRTEPLQYAFCKISDKVSGPFSALSSAVGRTGPKGLLS